MIFDKTSSNIKLFEENGKHIKLEEMFSLLSSVMKDVYKDAAVDGAEELEVEDYKKLITSVIYTLQETCAAAEKSRQGAHEVEEYTFQMLQEERKRADELKEEWSSIEQKISKIEQEIKAIQEETKKKNEDIERVKTRKEEAEHELADKTQELSDLMTRTASVDTDLAKKSEDVKKAGEELNSLLASVADKVRSLNEQEALYANTYTALHSYLNEEFIADNLFGAGDASEMLSPGDVPDLPGIGRQIASMSDLKSWMTETELRLDGLTKVYRAELQKIASFSESLTKASSDSGDKA